MLFLFYTGFYKIYGTLCPLPLLYDDNKKGDGSIMFVHNMLNVRIQQAKTIFTANYFGFKNFSGVQTKCSLTVGRLCVTAYTL